MPGPLHDTVPAPETDPPYAAAVFTDAPDRIKEALLAAFDIQALYRNEKDQVTIWATLTDDTPRTIAALLADPRTDSDTGTVTPGADRVLPVSTRPYDVGSDPRSRPARYGPGVTSSASGSRYWSGSISSRPAPSCCIASLISRKARPGG